MIDQIVSNYTLQMVLLGTSLLGATAGVIGVFLVLRKQALIGDTLSHATLPGIVLAYIISQNSSLHTSIIGAIVAAILSLFFIEVVKRYSIIKNDVLLAIILSSMFGFGQVLLSIIRDTAGQDQARLNSFIFGQAATMSSGDIELLVAILVITLFLTALLWRHIKLFIFDQEFYRSLGFRASLIRHVLSILTIMVVVSGIQSVGVILMNALLIAPAVAARFWSDRLSINVILAGIIGSLSGSIGSLYSTNLPTGPVIVIVSTSFVIFSMVFSMKKGLVWNIINNKIHQRQIKKYRGLIHLFETNQWDSISKEAVHELEISGFISKHNNNYEISRKGKDKVMEILKGELS